MNNNKMQQAINDIQNGKMIIVTDDKNRENEGDLVIAAEKITPDAINFMSRFGRGLICMPMSDDYFTRLHIPMMVNENESSHQTPFGVSIGAANNITTGISAADRAHTIRVAANPLSQPGDIVKPGHIFPLKANKSGVLKRKGHTEASVDLMILAGFNPAAVICEIMNDDGTMAREADLMTFAKQHQLTMISIQELIEYRLRTENCVTKISSANLPTRYGMMHIHYFKNKLDELDWIAITSGDIQKQLAPFVRLHSQCLTGDVLGSQRCDCGEQLQLSLQKIAQSGGVLLYLPQEGRGIGLENKVRSYALQDTGVDTVEANHQLGFESDLRDYYIPAQILKYFQIHAVSLMTNNPHKIAALEKYGIAVTARIPLRAPTNDANAFYLKTKQEKMGHYLI